MLDTGMPYLVPLISALIGWLTAKGVTAVYISFLLKKKKQIGAAIGAYAAQQVPLDAMEQKLTDPASIESILPFAETQVDNFLRVKLPAAMPMLSMFISDKLVAEMKAIFMTELKELFPALIKQYTGSLKKSININQIVSTRLDEISLRSLRRFLWKQFRVVEIAGALAGLLCGCFYIFLTRIA